MYFAFNGSLSSWVLQSTEAATVSHLVSTFASYPLKIGEAADNDRNSGDKIEN